MKIAICYKGIHYSNDTIVVDYRNCIQNHKNYLIDPLKKDNDVDIYCFSYESDIMEQLAKDYNTKGVVLLKREERYNGNNWYRSLTFYKMICEYLNEFNEIYDTIIILRYDILFKIPLIEWTIDYNKVNFPFKHFDCNNVEDTVIIYPFKHNKYLYDSITTVINREGITHEINHYIPIEYIHFCYALTEEDCLTKSEYKYYTFNRIHK